MAEIDFSFLDDFFTDEDTTDYSYMFDDSDDGAVNLDFNYDPNNYGIGAFDVSSLFNDDDDFSYLFGSDDGIANLDFDYKPGVDFSDVYSSLFDEPADYDDTVKELYPDLFMDSTQDLIANADTSNNLLDTILGFVGGKKGKNKAQGIMSGVGDVVNSPVGQLALLNYLKNQREQDIKIPIGQEAYGGGQGLGSMPDYRIFNLQPALMPGVGYANAPPPEMKHGGLASLDQGPGDITLARLEPGEFVMTRKATDNIGAKNLYRLMKEAERMA